MPQEIKYVQLEPAAFLTDIDFQLMNAEQRGVYCSIIMYLYANNGKIDLGDNIDITLLENGCNRLGTISGCYKIGVEWEQIWSKMSHKFKITGNVLTHKRVTAELQTAKGRVEAASEAGKRGMKSRWGDNDLITKVSKVKVSKVKEYSPTSDEVRLSSRLGMLILKRKPDHRDVRNAERDKWQRWAGEINKMIRLDKRKPERIEMVILWSQKDIFWQNNILSVVKLRQQFDKLELQMGDKNGSANRRDYSQETTSTYGGCIEV